MTRYLLIGNGIAANSAAARIRDLDPEASITFVTDEPEPYFSRCALMYYVMDHCSRRDLYLHQGRRHEDLRAELIFDTVLGVNASASTVELQKRGAVSYDKLLIASGGLGRRLGVPGEDADGITNFNTLPDADYVLQCLKTAQRGVVIGGGLIGAEVAEVFHELGLQTDYLIREQSFYPLFCSRSQSQIIECRFERFGIRVHVGRTVDRFEVGPQGQVAAVVDNAGDRYPCDLVVRSIGIDPNIAFLAASGIETDTGVVVDQRLRTNVENVWAAGDCAEIRVPGSERPTIRKLWYTAQPQGWIAGENMAGGNATYDPGPLYQSAMFMDLDFAQYGDVPMSGNDLQEESIDSPNGLDSLRLVHDGEVVVGASFLGTSLTKEDLEAMVVDRWRVERARAIIEQMFHVKHRRDRAPRSRIDLRRNWSRLPRGKLDGGIFASAAGETTPPPETRDRRGVSGNHTKMSPSHFPVPVLGFLLLISAIYLSALLPAYWWAPIVVFLVLAVALRKWHAFPFIAMAVLFVAYAFAQEFGHWQWLGMGAVFWYSTFYTVAVVAMGVRFLRDYWGKDRYMVTRTCFNMGAQLIIGYLLPYLWPFQWGGGAPDSQGKGVFFMYYWPLENSSLIIARLEGMTPLVRTFLAFNIIAALIVMPILVYYYGRRVYCSWLCGCGCLAETVGDPFRRLTPRSRLSRTVEPVIYPFLLATTLLTIGWLVAPQSANALMSGLDHSYLLIVKFIFSTVLGVGLYSLMGARIWCRYFCPWVALFGLVAKYGRYAIRTRGDLCMGCGMCNTYCEMGIDIRGVAMEGRPVKTTTCVGCGMCIQKCPRRVLSFAME